MLRYFFGNRLEDSGELFRGLDAAEAQMQKRAKQAGVTLYSVIAAVLCLKQFTI